jgi:hypothetical protein
MASGFEALLINPYIVGFLIPLLFLIAGSFIKKIVRGSGWQREDFYLGIELVLWLFWFLCGNEVYTDRISAK